jgi:2-methylcitrate dehydratase PrpD
VTDPQGPTGRLAIWLAEVPFDHIPALVRERAKYLLLDGLGCALVGAQLPWSRTAVESVTRFEGRGEKTIIGWGKTTSAPAAALLNGTFIQGFELDDYHPLAPLHSASLILPALLACAEEIGRVEGKQFLRAAILGCEIGPRVGMALHGAQMLSRGWHSGPVFGTFASAAAVGALLGLDPAGFEDALGLAGTQSAGLMAAQYESMGKRMHHGFSSRNGLYAAFLASAGYTGIKRVFEREYGGFLSTFGEGHEPDASQINDGLGKRWETERIVVKPYAAQGALHAALDALFTLFAQYSFRPEDVARIDIDLSKAAYHHGWWQVERPLTPIGAQMNIAYSVAVALLDGAAMIQQYTPQRIAQEDVWELIPKITARHEPEFDASRITQGHTRMRITLADGTRLETFQAMPRTIQQPLSNDKIVAKFRTLTREIVNAERQARIEHLVLHIEEEVDVRELCQVLASPVGAVFAEGENKDESKAGGKTDEQTSCGQASPWYPRR